MNPHHSDPDSSMLFVKYCRRFFHLGSTCLVAASLLLSVSCSAPQGEIRSSTKVTDIKHTVVKRQSIGNCWVYGEATWIESMLKAYTGEDVNISESYWTWWHWYTQLTEPSFAGKKIETGGSTNVARALILLHGWVLEGEFIPAEADAEMSQNQSKALAFVNAEITRGRLDSAQKRTPDNVRKVLDEAFTSNMQQTESLARSAEQTFVGRDTNSPISLADTLAGSPDRRWRTIWFPLSNKERKETLVRVFRALNDYHPVMMEIAVDFNALDLADNGSFKKKQLDSVGEPGSQGGHVVVLKDYIVENVPGYGLLGRGDLSPAEKAAALKGDLVALVAKNSWGINRLDRGMIDGYTTFYKDYLYGPIQWKPEDEPGAEASLITPLESFLLPPGY